MQRKYIAACIAGTLILSGCAGHMHSPYRDGRPPIGLQISFIAKAPPPPRRVTIPPRPVIGAIWIDGYWNWTGVRFVWVDGFWDRNPPRNRIWEKSRWVHSNQGWYRTPGRWKER
tara:strand:- start:3773 stop:4117 length:345 start_codon:yes stop_codon:yes gene_type:complete